MDAEDLLDIKDFDPLEHLLRYKLFLTRQKPTDPDALRPAALVEEHVSTSLASCELSRASSLVGLASCKSTPYESTRWLEKAIVYGRPDWQNILEEEKARLHGLRTNVGVFYCGGARARDELERLCSEMSEFGGVTFDFYPESFGL